MNWPNRLTITRLFFVPFIIISIIYRQNDNVILSYLPLVLFSVGAITDACDGFIARRYNQKTALGTILDPLADKTLILATLISLQFSSSFTIKMPVWGLVIVAFRDVIIVMWLIVSYMNHIRIVIRPNLIGKITTFLQMLTIVSLLVEFKHAYYLWYSMLFVTVVSTASYMYRERHVLNEAGRNRDGDGVF